MTRLMWWSMLGRRGPWILLRFRLALTVLHAHPALVLPRVVIGTFP